MPGLEFKNQRVEAAFRKDLVLGEDAFVDHAVHDRLSFFQSSLGFIVVTGLDLGVDLFHVGACHGTQAGVMLAVFLVLTSALLGLRGICHRKTPENSLL